jgi:predicted component of type VI protein secretion system
MRTALVLAVLLLALAGCSAEPASSTASSPVTSSVASMATTTPTTTTAPPATVGQSVSNEGITLTVTEAHGVDSIQMNESNFRPGSGYEKYTRKTPDAGGRFVAVTAQVVNNAKVSLDLTCSLPINTKLVDSQQRNFDPIDDLYKLKGNPECNDQLQPGFEADMTWVYLVPTSASIVGWGFEDTTDLSNMGDFTTVRFDA